MAKLNPKIINEPKQHIKKPNQ